MLQLWEKEEFLAESPIDEDLNVEEAADELECDEEDANAGAVRLPFQSAFLMDVLPEIPEDAHEQQETFLSEYSKRNLLTASVVSGMQSQLNSVHVITDASPRGSCNGGEDEDRNSEEILADTIRKLDMAEIP